MPRERDPLRGRSPAQGRGRSRMITRRRSRVRAWKSHCLHGETALSVPTSGDGPGASFLIRAPDGVSIAVWEEGDGPPMVLVHGSLGDHTAWAVPVAELSRHFTTYALDRRGFGASGDGETYSIEHDFADVAAVIEDVATRTGQKVTVWGHSYGANCAMGAANVSSLVDHLILYEPSLGLRYPDGSIESAEAALEVGDRETAVIRLLVDALEMSDDEVEALRSSPRWPNLLAGAHTGPRECRVEEGWTYEPGQFGDIAASTLLLSGSESPGSLVEATRRAAEAIADPHIHILEGHSHFAHRTHPEMLVSIIREFIS